MRNAAATPGDAEISRPLLQLRPRALWRAFSTSPWSFRWTCVYVFFEYVRPQSIYTFLQGIPWAAGSLLLALVAFISEGARVRSRTVINAGIVAFSLVVLASSLTAAFPDASWRELPVYINWVIAFVLVANTVTTERRWFIFMVLFLLFSLKMSQHGFRTWAMRGFGFASWGVSGSPGWFLNSGEFALQMGVFVPLSVYFAIAVGPFVKKYIRFALWGLPVTGVGSIIASSSRGGYLALAMIGLIAAVRSPQRMRNIGLLVALTPLFWLITPEQQKARFSSAGQDATSQLRLLYWERGMEMASEHPVLGVGHGNWIPYYRASYYNPADTTNRFDSRGELKIELAHNSFVEVASQLGFSGLTIFISLLVSIFVVNAKSRILLKRIGERGRFLHLMSRGLDDGTVAFAVAGFFMSVAFYPFIWFQLAMTGALHAAALNLVRFASASGTASAASQNAARRAYFRTRFGHATWRPTTGTVTPASRPRTT